MAEPVIRVENVAKRYIIAHQQRNQHTTLKDAVSAAARAALHKVRSPQHAAGMYSTREEFWALRDVSLEVRQGERVGIIGRNGAGKSTLLKILSRITEPTAGRVRIRGRVASLLEVGTGFHPELTGRENIFLNGAVLGMSRAEIKKKFDEIVAFAEVEKFLDTPVKRYSSGMYVRLAFAVAAHLEPEILIVDEVLAVGDVAFQRKCLGKMEDVATRQGRTILFVSHSLSAVQSLCDRAIWLDGGRIKEDGDVHIVTQRYHQAALPMMNVPLELNTNRSGDGSVRITAVAIESLDEDRIIRPTSRLRITLHYRSDVALRYPQFSVTIYDHVNNIGLISLHSETSGGLPEELPPNGRVTCITEPLYLTPGKCYVNLTVLRGGIRADYIQHAAYFDVEPADIFGTGRIPEREWVVCLREYTWSVDGI